MPITSRVTALVPAALALLALGACGGGDQPKVDAPTTSTSATAPTATPSTSPSPSVPANAQDAVRAYESYNTALRAAQQDPPTQPGGPLAAGTDYTKYSFDPERARANAIIARLSSLNHAIQGTPPKANVSVLSANTEAKPYPTVTLKVCFSPSPAWEEYDRKTKTVVGPVKIGTVPSKVDVIYYQNRWGVSRTVAGEGTCDQ